MRVTSKAQVRAFAATAEARLPDMSTVAQMAGSARFVSERMSRQGEDERVRLLRSRRQLLEMQAQEEERLRVAEDGPLQEDLERHLFFLDRQVGRLHELLLYMVQAVPARTGVEAQGAGGRGRRAGPAAARSDEETQGHYRLPLNTPRRADSSTQRASTQPSPAPRTCQVSPVCQA
ncbi:hypothetical protein [Deinococcus aestuarii]|uniref:hypothetical protein n=1 Tax=Deinococcus aestuarii TaxID=2774531 RepID=UPI001C0CCD74|nr:hypothetical protein [Deinococcus aestuarii]